MYLTFMINYYRKIKIECSKCSGTGIISESENGSKIKSEVCANCEGKGWVVFEYRIFTGRKKARGVKKIKKLNSNEMINYNNFELLYPVISIPKPISYIKENK